jgi:hypothetical protein
LAVFDELNSFYRCFATRELGPDGYNMGGYCSDPVGFGCGNAATSAVAAWYGRRFQIEERKRADRQLARYMLN